MAGSGVFVVEPNKGLPVAGAATLANIEVGLLGGKLEDADITEV